MKKIFFAAVISLAVLTSCSDFLDQDNKSNIATSDFYKTKVGFESLVNSTYSSLRTIYGGDPWLFSAGTDLYASGRVAVDKVGLLGAGYSNTTASVQTFYTDCYKGISLANDVIYYSSKTEANAKLDQYVDEARFFRAYYYFLLVQNFGDVVLIKDHLSSPVTSMERTPAAQVYDFIISEMKDLASTDSHLITLSSGTNFGRVDIRTVNHFLAKAYLTRGYESYGSTSDFTDAKAYADLAINGQKLTIPFSSVFSIANEQNAEIIFSVQYDSKSVSDPSTQGNKQQAEFGAYLNGSEAGHKYTTSYLTPTLRLHQLFSQGDERYEGTFMTLLYNHYYDYYTMKAADLAKDNVYAYYVPEWAVADTAAWRAASSTRARTLIIPMMASGRNVNGKITTYEKKMTDDVYGVACIRKFDDPTSAFSQTSSMHDIYLARVAETYLIAAEALIKAGKPGEAVAYVNEVRNRAKAQVVTEAQLTGEAGIDFILDERARELAGEYHRWADLKRTGRLMDYVVRYNPDIPSKDAYLGTDGNYKILRPIPLKAMELNGVLTQNPGY